MPPKQPVKKGGKDDQEDFSDVPTLPPLNSYIFTLLYENFRSTEIREGLQKLVAEKLPLDRVKTLTREEIITYGKLKQIILEPHVIPTIPQDDPRHKMSESEQLAKAAVDRLFELSVHTRRAKKERLLKLEEELKLQGIQDIQQALHERLDSDQLDVAFQLIDFPSGRAEVMAFAKYNHSLNCVFEINQAQKPVLTEEEIEQGIEQEYQEEEEVEISQAEQEYRTKIKNRLSILMEARESSVKNSSLRNLAFIQVPYSNQPKITIKINEMGEEIEERKEPGLNFIQETLNNKLEHSGALYIKYLRFRDKVKTDVFAIDQKTLAQVRSLQSDDQWYTNWQEEQQQVLAGLTQDPSGMNTEQIREIQENKKRVEQAIEANSVQTQDRKSHLQILNQRLKKVSVDDEKDPAQFKLDFYKKDFISHKETQNSISSVMSAMLSQINMENNSLQVSLELQGNNGDGSTTIDDGESLDDLFDAHQQELYYITGQQTRPAPGAQDEGGLSQYNSKPAATNNFLSLPTGKAKKEGAESLARTHTAVGEIEYTEQLDQARQCMYKLPKEVTDDEEDKAQDIYLREKKLFRNLVIPAANRYLMPEVPTKSQRLRALERPSMYPFCTLPVEDVERSLVLKQFQDLIKSNQIDEGQTPKERHAKYKAFERHYQSHMKSDILRQVIADIYLQEPEMASLYYPREDSLLVAFYNKKKGVEEREEGNGDNQEEACEGEREWRAAYRIMPDFENWINYFADELIVKQPLNQTQHQLTQPHIPKYTFDDEMLPESLIDIDDRKIQNVMEQSQMMYPSDNSIMRVDHYEVGGQKYSKSSIIKDNLTFGLRQAQKGAELEIGSSDKGKDKEDFEYGLFSYNKTGETELWINFENNTKFVAEAIGMKRNEKRLIRIDPPKPTAEEIAAREEQVRLAQAALLKQKPKPGQPVAPIIEEYKEPEPTWEPEPYDVLDSVYQDYEVDEYQGVMVTTSYANGLIIQHMPNGDICQTNESQLFDTRKDEKYRTINSKGIVIRHLRNNDREVLYPSGIRSYFDRKNMMWVVTNNKGRRTATKDGISWDIESIPCATETDAVSHARMMIREDSVMTIEFRDGSFYCQHADGTQIRTSADKSEIRVEKDDFAPVVVKDWTGNLVKNIYSDKAGQSAKDRAIDGIVVSTFLPDGTLVETFQPDQYRKCHHIFNRPDFSIVFVDGEGDIRIISSNARSALNEEGGRSSMGNDIDYLYEQSGVAERNRTGVYYATLAGPSQSPICIQTENLTGSIKYILNSNNTLSKITSEGGNNQANQQEDTDLDESNRLQTGTNVDDGRDIEEVGGAKNPFTKHYIYPRLFVIKTDGSGCELLSREQLDYYFRLQKHKEECIKQRKVVMVGSTAAKSHYFLAKVQSMSDKEQQLSQLKTLDFPQNAMYALQRTLVKKPRTDKPTHTQPQQYLFRQLFEFSEIEAFKQESFYDDIYRYKQWRMTQVRYDTEFGITFAATKENPNPNYKFIDEEEQASRRIIMKIYKERRNKRVLFNPDEFKRAFMNEMNKNDEVSEYLRRTTQVEHTSSWNTQVPNSNRPNKFLDAEMLDKQAIKDQKIDNMTQENWRHKKKANAEMKLKHYLSEIQRMINTPSFVKNYFRTKDGQHFVKNNPEKTVSHEILMRMSQRINRSQQNTEKAGAAGQSQYDGYSQKSGGQSPNHNIDGSGEDRDDPIVALEPEDHLKQGSAFMGSKKSRQLGTQGQVGQMPDGQNASLYLQERVYHVQRDQEHMLKAEEYHVIKTKDFNVYGRLRQDKPFVKAIQKSGAQSDLNEKFITTECIADRRVKISSMASRQYSNAPSVENVRKQGQHQMILQAINKKQTFPELINQANAMVTSVLHDPLKRSLNVMPSKCKFGTVKAGGVYEVILTLKNEDSQAARISIKPTIDKRIVVQQTDFGPIAPGMTKKVSVMVKIIDEGDQGNIKEDILISTKHDIFRIPVEALVMTPMKYDEANRESQALQGKGVQSSRVREKLNQSVFAAGKYQGIGGQRSGIEVMDQDMGAAYEYEGSMGGAKPAKNWIETTGSESKLPHLPTVGKRAFEVDPKRPLNEVMKK